MGIALDAAGNVYITDTENHCIQKFTKDGAFLASWGNRGAGTGDGRFNNPTGIAVDAIGNLYIADSNNNRIQIFEYLY